MKVKISEERTADGLYRIYTATAKGETVTAKVINAGYGWHIFWQKVLAKWPKAYVS